ncbi:MAG TPA: beta-N-acetylglucosaminidase domain-containing protein, partial [Thermoleophilaceae bacterium]|nr:beta-N-acetylglucosaminidase domain-containing protein [Thermoleophilaceae bacterium]
MIRAPAAALAALALLAVCPAAEGRSPFGWRGVVEGAYGPTWDHGARSRVLRWMPRHGFNAYVHAPKDDLYQRTYWRDKYPAAEMAAFRSEIRAARARGVRWIPNLSPALPLLPTPRVPDRPPSRDLCFSCPADLAAVVAKLRPFRRAGAHTTMISFDDVTKTFSHPEDGAAYGAGDEAFGRANGDFLSRLYRALRARDPRARLLTVGADYSGTQDTDYLRGLRATLRREVEVMWTGVTVPSHAFSPAEARAYGRWIGRRPLVWDNWTDDDTSGNATPLGTARIFLGPYLRRPDVAGAVGGFFLNPMNEADLNLLPLATAGDWMRDPRRYARRASWLRAVRELAGPGRVLRGTLRAWAETSWSTKLDLNEAPTFVRSSRRFLRAYDSRATWLGAAGRLRRELSLVAGAPRRLTAVPRIRGQARPFVDAAAQAAGAGRLGARLLAAERPLLRMRRTRSGFLGSAHPPTADRAALIRSRFQEEDDASRRSRYFTYGWRTPYAFDIPPYPVPPNVMDAFLDQVAARDSAWQGRADEAETSVHVSVGGRRVRLSPSGAFRLGRRAC